MSYTAKQLVENTLELTCNWIREQDYTVRNESEFCNIFFYNLFTILPKSNIKPSQIRSEVKQFKPGVMSRKQVASSVDFGVASALNGSEYDLFLEVKTRGPLEHRVGMVEVKGDIERALHEAKGVLDER